MAYTGRWLSSKFQLCNRDFRETAQGTATRGAEQLCKINLFADVATFTANYANFGKCQSEKVLGPPSSPDLLFKNRSDSPYILSSQPKQVLCH